MTSESGRSKTEWRPLSSVKCTYCVIECMHVHASDRKLTETGSAKFFVKDNGDTLVQNRGILNDREIRKIQEFIKQNYQEMYLKWSEYSQEGFYEKNIC